MCVAEVKGVAPGATAQPGQKRAPSFGRRVIINLRWMFGVLFTLNFLVCWAVPIGVQGQSWKLGLQYVLRPIYDFLDQNKCAPCP